jgi:phosphoenolpyruvate carboxylase
MNIGSRPAKRRPSGGIETLRAIPWIFAWTQTRFHLPVWLGFGAAFKQVIAKDVKNLHMLQEMYNQWPFFRVTIDLVEMVFAKGDPGIAALNDRLLVSQDLWPFGEQLRSKYEETKKLLLQVMLLLLCKFEHFSFAVKGLFGSTYLNLSTVHKLFSAYFHKLSGITYENSFTLLYLLL